MASPFPGMDPYLEATDLWPGLHHLLISESVTYLQPQLRARGYFAGIEERIYLIEPDQDYLPDMIVREKPQPPAVPPLPAIVAVADKPALHDRRLVEYRESFIEIYQTKPRKLVTVIEVLSPTNKLSADGRRLFRKKQRDVHKAGLHLIEIDLLRRGKRLSRISADAVRKEGRFEYLVNIDRLEAIQFEFYPIRLRNRLPKVVIPLKMGETDAVLDLQAALDTSYEVGAFADRIDYTLAPSPLLADDDALWADQLLKDKGLR